MTNTTVLNGAATAARAIEMIGGALYNPAQVEQWINVPSWNGLIVCFRNGSNVWVYGENAVLLWRFAQNLPEFSPGFPGQRLVRPGNLHLLPRNK